MTYLSTVEALASGPPFYRKIFFKLIFTIIDIMKIESLSGKNEIFLYKNKFYILKSIIRSLFYETYYFISIVKNNFFLPTVLHFQISIYIFF